MKRLLEWVALFDSTLSAAEWIWRLLALAILATGGTAAGLLAKDTAALQDFGPLLWAAIGLLVALLMALTLYLVKRANLESAQAEYTRAVATQKRATNPLQESYRDEVIHLEDLRLPGKQLHENKHFKRCKIVGPGAIAILGGTYVDSGFIDCGDVIVLPDNAYLTGIIALKNCTVEQCEFFRVTIFTSSGEGKAFAKMGAKVLGLPAT